jgi:hypothetical protein
MVTDVFGLHGREPTPHEVVAGAKALRDRQMKGRLTRAWEDLPQSDKRKWLGHSEAVLRAALSR